MKNPVSKGIAYAMIVVSLTLTLLQGYFTFFTRFWLTTIIGLAVSIHLSSNFLHKKPFSFLLLYTAIVVFNTMIGDGFFGNMGNAVLEICSLMLTCFMFWGLIKGSDVKTQGVVVYSFVIVLFITTVGTFFADQLSPGIVRHAFGAHVTGDDKGLLYEFYKMGMSNYTLPHAVPVLIPGVVYGIKCYTAFTKKVRAILWVALTSLMLIAYLSGATTALLLSLLSLAICFSMEPGNDQTNLIRIMVLLIIASPFLLSKDIQLSILDGADGIIPDGSYFHRKIDVFRESVLNPEADVMETREHLYEKSSSEFFAHPIFGSNNPVGGHSSFLDRLATLGIIGIIPFVLFLITQFKETQRIINPHARMFYVVGFSMGILMCCMKTSWNLDMHFSMFVFLPISIIFFRNISVEKK